MLAGQSLAIFTFSFRDCEGGCKTSDRPGFLLDAQAAMQKASELEGIDPQRIVVIGASIGADGAADGCSWLNTQAGKGHCLGALSLSPGNYLTIPYAVAVAVLEAEQPPKPVWCLFSKSDQPSAAACTAASCERYRQIAYGGNRHGMALVDPKVEPNALQLVLDFLKLNLGL
jgi:dienelactone hydrolase